MDWDRRLTALLDAGGPLMLFQPIVHLSSGVTAGYEALARFPEELIDLRDPEQAAAGFRFGPDVWFRTAKLLGRDFDLEQAAARNALARCDDLPDGAYLSVNASPQLLISREFELLAAASGCDRSRLIVEVTEHEAISDYATLRAALAPIRQQGSRLGVDRIRVAVDDVGAGFASMRHLLDLRPDLIKLDIGLVRGVDSDRARRALCEALTFFAHTMGMTVAAEGVETAAERSALTDIGVEYGQGWHFGYPAGLP